MLDNDPKNGLEGNLYFKYDNIDWQYVGYVNNFVVDEIQNKGFVEVIFINHENLFYNIKNKENILFKFGLDPNCHGKENEAFILDGVKITSKVFKTNDLNSVYSDIVYRYSFIFNDMKWYDEKELECEKMRDFAKLITKYIQEEVDRIN